MNELLRDDCVECSTEVYEQHSDIRVFFVQMCEGWVEGSGDGIIGRAVGPICKLEGVQAGRQGGRQAGREAGRQGGREAGRREGGREGGGADLMWCMTSRSKHFMRIGVSATGR